jgi:hypothetical protein
VGERILFVEDDADFREIFTLTLREALAPEWLDVAFVEAGSMTEARARLREGSLINSRSALMMPPGRSQFIFPRRDGLIGGPNERKYGVSRLPGSGLSTR